MQYNSFFSKLSPAMIRDIVGYLSKWIITFEVDNPKIMNLCDEHFLSEGSMLEIYKIISSSFGNNFQDTLRRLIKHADVNTLQGGNIRIKKPGLFIGTVIPRNSFSEYLLKNYRSLFNGSTKEIDDFLDIICFDVKRINPKYYDIKIKSDERIIWFTWDKMNYSSNPFYFLNTEYAEEAMSALGLGFDVYKNQKLLAFVFESKTDHLFRPTICDSGYNNYFRPAPINFIEHGVTFPLMGGFYTINGMNYEISNRARDLPETVANGGNFIVKHISTCKPLFTI